MTYPPTAWDGLSQVIETDADSPQLLKRRVSAAASAAQEYVGNAKYLE